MSKTIKLIRVVGRFNAKEAQIERHEVEATVTPRRYKIPRSADHYSDFKLLPRDQLNKIQTRSNDLRHGLLFVCYCGEPNVEEIEAEILEQAGELLTHTQNLLSQTVDKFYELKDA